ncbi:MAG TPA: hypothetical protein VFG65_00650 [Fimbriimonadales bacterium]|jgi:hypothetical protein|nr:hypothetical protein [Fimbriimonadales bacterium]
MAAPVRDPGTPLRRFVGCGLIGCLAVFAICGYILYRAVAGAGGFIAALTGDRSETFALASPRRFDPLKQFEAIHRRVGQKARLVSIRATGVRPDGTMDLTANFTPAPRATYEFFAITTKDAAKMPPVGAGRRPHDVWAEQITADCYRPGTRSRITKISGNLRSSYYRVNQGVTIDRRDPAMIDPDTAAPDPTLTTEEMWKEALGKGANKDAVATIEYDSNGYSFTISGSGYVLRWKPDGSFEPKQSSYPK